MKIQVAAISRVPYLPYVYGLLRAYIEDREPELASQLMWGKPLIIERPVAKLLDEIDEDTDVLAMSCYMWNFNRQMKLARLVKERNPDCKVIVGGAHIPNDLGDFFLKHPYVDVTIHGEGEISFAEVLKNGPDGLPGVSTAFWNGGPVGPKLPKDIVVKSPYTAGYFDDYVRKLNDAGIEYWGLWETNRGCPYQCTFCDWGSALMNKVRRFDEERLHKDIEWFGIMGVDRVFIADANFGLLPRDIDIAKKMAHVKEVTGSPKEMRATFAKGSNDRVFEISRIFADAQMSHGTTISMQSMDEQVLAAVKRANIGTAKYADLQVRFNQVDIPTYTEMILGMPKETKDSFIGGVCTLLEGGNHDDIKVWELMMLPNAPMRAQMDTFGMKTVRKNLYLESPRTLADEIETKDVVMETDTMSFEDWVDTYLFSIMVQALHCGYWTRYVAMYMRGQHVISYRQFYEELMHWAMGDKNSVLGQALWKLKNKLYEYADNQTNSLWQKIHSDFGPRRCQPSDWLWFEIAAKSNQFYADLQVFDNTAFLLFDLHYTDVCRYNQWLMLDIDYDPEIGKRFTFEADWDRYFNGDGELVYNQTHMRAFDTHTGIDDRYPLVPGNGPAFNKAAIGDGFYIIGRYHLYIHRKVERIENLD